MCEVPSARYEDKLGRRARCEYRSEVRHNGNVKASKMLGDLCVCRAENLPVGHPRRHFRKRSVIQKRFVSEAGWQSRRVQEQLHVVVRVLPKTDRQLIHEVAEECNSHATTSC